MPRRFNPPPGWPTPPPDWKPPPGWKPDPSWPAPPHGWQLWTRESSRPVRAVKRVYLGPRDHSPTRRALRGVICAPAPPTTPTEEPPAQSPPTEEPPPTDEPEPSEEPDSDVDPRFDTCKEANAHGYGPYRRGENPEYYWYIDRDHDGIDCEPR